MRLSLLLFVSAVLCSTVLRADPLPPVYSNFDPGHTYTSGSGLAVGAGVAIPFVVPEIVPNNDPDELTWALSAIEIAAFAGDPDQTVDVGLYNTIGDVPGVAQEPLITVPVTAFDEILDPSAYLIVVNSFLNPVLTGGAEYWVVLANAPDVTWASANSQQGISQLVNGIWSAVQDRYTQGAVEVDGIQVPVVAPEPRPLLALGSAMLAMFLPIRRRAPDKLLSQQPKAALARFFRI